ncbi:MAG TPA: sensor histidine kinase [Bacteroidota bacterium]|nr:sensor histidine kinase [Bacteroidota bacterium]
MKPPVQHLSSPEGGLLLRERASADARIRRLEEQLHSAVREKETLLREVHHRVKNNLQLISSMLRMQSSTAADARSAQFFDESQRRLKAMAMIHEQLYHSHDLGRIDMGEYLLTLTLSVLRSYGAPCTIVPVIRVQELYLGVESAIPCGLIVTELVSNAMKYAFPGQNPCGTISVTLCCLPEARAKFCLTVSDDGIGLPSGVDPETASSLGLKLVGILTEQLWGSIEIRRTQGTEFVIVFSEAPETVPHDGIANTSDHTL